MIQINGVSPFSATTSTEPSLINTANQTNSSNFQSELSAALTTTLEQFGINPNTISLSIAPIVTGSTQSQAAASTPASVTPTASSGDDSSTSAAGASEDPVLAFDDAYWASQPPAVQALRNMDDPTQRSMAAAQLAASGYQIDTPIMVWGWDPSKVTTLRQDMGYTWVPSALQNPIAAAPGVNDGVSQPYDPSNPPSGSIIV